MDRNSVAVIAKAVAGAPNKPAASKILLHYGLSPGTPPYRDFVDSVREALNRPGDYLDLTPEELVEFLDYLPRFIAQSIYRLPSKLTMKQLERVLAQEPEVMPEDAAVTTTANTAPYPVPIGQKMLRRKIGEAFSRNSSLQPKWIEGGPSRRFVKIKDLIE